MIHETRVRAAVDALWSVAMLGALAFYFRAEIARVWNDMERDIKNREAVQVEAKRRIGHRSEFLTYLQEHGIEPSRHDLGMEP